MNLPPYNGSLEDYTQYEGSFQELMMSDDVRLGERGNFVMKHTIETLRHIILVAFIEKIDEHLGRNSLERSVIGGNFFGANLFSGKSVGGKFWRKNCVGANFFKIK
ncbi:hypothetical protein Dimus_007719 [Dionaea muscipula]